MKIRGGMKIIIGGVAIKKRSDVMSERFYLYLYIIMRLMNYRDASEQ